MTLALTNRPIIERFQLVQITINSNVLRYCTCGGYIDYQSHYWYSKTDAQGAIINLGDIQDGGDSVANINLTVTPAFVFAEAIANEKWARSKVLIYQGERNPTTGVVQIDENYTRWEIDQYSHELTKPIDFTLVSPTIVKKIKSDVFTTSSESQARILPTGTIDKAFDYISSNAEKNK